MAGCPGYGMGIGMDMGMFMCGCMCAPPCTGHGSPSQVAVARAGTERALFTVPGGPGCMGGPGGYMRGGPWGTPTLSLSSVDEDEVEDEDEVAEGERGREGGLPLEPDGREAG